MKKFWLDRRIDDSHVSGTGIVAEGIVWTNGKVTLCWYGARTSINNYECIDHVIEIHGHKGHTTVLYDSLESHSASITSINKKLDQLLKLNRTKLLK